MHLYCAGIYTANIARGSNVYGLKLTDRERAGIDAVDYYLESYHYINDNLIPDRIRANGIKIFLDSGAYTAYTKGHEIDLPTYCNWIRHNQDIIETQDGVAMIAVLDKINDALGTYQNQKWMESLGVQPIPCFHYGEDERYLEWYMQHYDYVSIGGMAFVAKPQLEMWLDRIWGQYLCDRSGRPQIKVHGFAMTNPNLMIRYPWHSVDSSSWVQISAHGNIFLNNKPLNCSSDSPMRKRPNQHLDTFAPIITDHIDQQIVAKGYDPERIRDITYARWAYCAEAYTQFGNALSKDRIFTLHQPELFT